ncbi:MAG: Mov34/MPN/PAD-1 family protein [Myxococcales bacterium]|nr:Mov34/MPN/PAD-1 family protein [Myxococcales bacterium]
MTVREVFFLIGEGGAVLHRDDGESASHIADSRARWEAIWENRDQLVELAHSHPAGPLAFSHEDETTMAALASALGKPLVFSVVTPGGMLRRQGGADERVESEPGWADDLRRASGLPPRP